MILAGLIFLIIFETCIGAAQNAASDACYWDQMQTKKYYTQNVDRDLARFLKQDPKLACFVKEKLDECFAPKSILDLDFDSNLIDTNSMTNPEIDYLRINYACKFNVTESDRKCMLNELGTLYEYDGCNSTKAKINEASKKVTEKCGKALGCFTQKFMTLSFLSERIHLRPCFSVPDGRVMNICNEDENYPGNDVVAVVKRENTNYTDIQTSTTSVLTTTLPTAVVKRDQNFFIFEAPRGLKKIDSPAEMEDEGVYREIEITFQLPLNIPTDNNGASVAIVKRENTNYTDAPTSTTSVQTTTLPTVVVKRGMKIIIFEGPRGLKKIDSPAQMEEEGAYRERKIEISFQLPSNIPTENNGASIYASSLTLFLISLLLTCFN